MVAGSAMLPFGIDGRAVLAAFEPSYYPPAMTGLRGDNEGSYTHAHGRALFGETSWGATTVLKEEYDLVVVGGGLSGLSAAFFYQQAHGRDKKVLILDTHADFGGQCARNEHTIGDSTRLIFGGSQTIVSPHARSETTLKLLDDLGVDLDRLKSAYDVDFYRRHNLRGVTYFNKRTFGEDRVVKHPFCYYQRFVQGLLRPELSFEEAVEQTPLSERGKAQLLRVLKGGVHLLDVPREELEDYIYSHSYFDYLKDTLGVDDPGVLEMARNSCIDNLGEGADVTTIGDALTTGGLGFDPASLKDVMGEERLREIPEGPRIHHGRRRPVRTSFPRWQRLPRAPAGEEDDSRRRAGRQLRGHRAVQVRLFRARQGRQYRPDKTEQHGRQCGAWRRSRQFERCLR